MYWTRINKDNIPEEMVLARDCYDNLALGYIYKEKDEDVYSLECDDGTLIK